MSLPGGLRGTPPPRVLLSGAEGWSGASEWRVLSGAVGQCVQWSHTWLPLPGGLGLSGRHWLSPTRVFVVRRVGRVLVCSSGSVAGRCVQAMRGHSGGVVHVHVSMLSA